MPWRGYGDKAAVLVSAVGQRCHAGISLKCDTAKPCPSSPSSERGPWVCCGSALARRSIVHSEGAARRRSGPPRRGDGLAGTKGSSVAAVNNGQPLSSALLTFWQPPANSVLIRWLGRTIHWSSLWMNAATNSVPIQRVLGTIFGHCLPSLLQTVGKGKVRASMGGKVLLFLALISL